MAQSDSTDRSETEHLDIVVPVFNEQECVPLFYEECLRVLSPLERYTFSVIYVDDGSVDNTLPEIKKLVDKYGESKVKYISFSRNFGKESAIYAGLLSSTGNLTVLMDVDLQHPPALLPEMLRIIADGCDSCAAYRGDRKGEIMVRSFFSRRFYELLNAISSVDIKPNSTDFRMMTRKMVDAVLLLSETARFTKGLFQWVGFKTEWVMFPNTERAAGKTKWNFWKLFLYSINGIVAFSVLPLRVSSILGAFITASAFVYAVFITIRTLISGAITSGFATTIVIMLFLGGVVISLLGVVGEYVAKIYQEVKQRPIYITRETNIIKNDKGKSNE